MSARRDLFLYSILGGGGAWTLFQLRPASSARPGLWLAWEAALLGAWCVWLASFVLHRRDREPLVTSDTATFTAQVLARQGEGLNEAALLAGVCGLLLLICGVALIQRSWSDADAHDPGWTWKTGWILGALGLAFAASTRTPRLTTWEGWRLVWTLPGAVMLGLTGLLLTWPAASSATLAWALVLLSAGNASSSRWL